VAWFYIVLLLGALGLVVLRIYFKLREAQTSRAESWDEQMIGRLRSQGYAPFNDYPVDFFLALPDAAACQAARARLEPEVRVDGAPGAGAGQVDVRAILKSFETPDETRALEHGKFELVHLGGMTLGRATYQPGWKWSTHVGPGLGLSRCSVEHVGLVLAGVATAAFDDGTIIELRAGQLFYIPPVPHDSWVVGDEPYVSLHFLGADKYAQA